MSESPALYALISPSSVARAAVQRLRWTSDALEAHSESQRAGRFAPWLRKCGSISWMASDLLGAAVTGQASVAEWASLMNAERLAKAGHALFAARAAGTDWLDQHATIAWSRLHHSMYADILLTRREFAPNAGTDWSASLSEASIRVLPGAEPAIAALSDDFLVYGGDWDTVALAESLATWVLI